MLFVAPLNVGDCLLAGFPCLFILWHLLVAFLRQKDNLSYASGWVIGCVNFLFLARIGSRINCFLFVALKKMWLKLVEISRVNSIDDRNGVCR